LFADNAKSLYSDLTTKPNGWYFSGNPQSLSGSNKSFFDAIYLKDGDKYFIPWRFFTGTFIHTNNSFENNRYENTIKANGITKKIYFKHTSSEGNSGNMDSYTKTLNANISKYTNDLHNNKNLALNYGTDKINKDVEIQNAQLKDEAQKTSKIASINGEIKALQTTQASLKTNATGLVSAQKSAQVTLDAANKSLNDNNEKLNQSDVDIKAKNAQIEALNKPSTPSSVTDLQKQAGTYNSNYEVAKSNLQTLVVKQPTFGEIASADTAYKSPNLNGFRDAIVKV
jgi:chromosome segregation ATPase